MMTLPVLLFEFILVLAGLIMLLLREEMKMRRLVNEEKEKSTMMAILSHKIRTPLTSIKWYTELLLSGDAGKLKVSQIELLNKVQQGINDSITLFNRFLQFSRAKMNHVISHPQAIDVETKLHGVVDALSEEISDRHHTIKWKSCNSRATAYVDPLLFHTVFDALISNAVVYTPPGGTITLCIEDDKDHVEIMVEDNGIGISEEEQKHIFQEFKRGGQAKLLNAGGSGLGLHLVRTLVEQSSGDIRFESKEGKGTMFFVQFPKFPS